MTDEQQKAIDNLRSNNYKLSDIIRDAVFKAAEKTRELIVASDNPKDLLDAIRVLETSAKMVGLSPKDSQVNVQINAISGFEFIELDLEEIKQISKQEEFEEAQLAVE